MAMISRDQQGSSQFERLPLVLVARILQHVKQCERLSKCATVCKRWAAAATAATVSVDLPWPRGKANVASEFHDRVGRLQPWLEQHAKQLVSLRLPSCLIDQWSVQRVLGAQLQLPCAELQQLSRLQLQKVDLDMLGGTLQNSKGVDSSSRSSSSQALPPMLPKLIDLQLVACRISSTFLAQMLQLSGLSCLKLQRLRGADNDVLRELGVCSTMLPQHPKLAHLELSCFGDVMPLAQMLPGSLTALSLDGGQLNCPCSLMQLVDLQKLSFAGVGFNPVMLSSMSKLLHLQLQQCALLSPDEGEEEEGVTEDGGHKDSSAVVLAAVGGMRQLQHLSFVTDFFSSFNLQDAEARQFSALTASTHLTFLELGCVNEQPLPAGAVQHMFPAGKRFPALQELLLHTCGHESGPGHITTAELRIVIGACPAISSLDISCVLQPNAEISALLQLAPTCRSLKIGGEAHDDGAAAVIAQLTQLTRLSWTESSDLLDAGLDRLTALQALEVLQLRELHGLSYGLVQKTDGFMDEDLDLTAGDQPVWQQLHDKIRSVSCNASWSRRLDSLAQVREQEASTARLQLDALSSYMDHVLVVMMFCSGSAEVMQAVRSMADLGRKVLSGTAVDAGQSHLAGAGGGAEVVAGLVQQYREL